ncbi:MAG: ParB/RepB/Spo0J family partition protein [Acetatifactor muris]|nr:ParB/RepB/Spo0J family partition protein [Acetatifactor muris]MCM1559583.1 ParB/RepB/Spo0J family partition protein [Butyrivibrio sp.]
MEEKVITYIEAGHIRPHPENPRKDLGDLSELVESIRKNGVLQNLTVIPVEGEPGEYMTLIGHRRYAAGTQAGVDRFPCQIAENLTPREQVSIMLEENMQRNDLTIWEQANGFQMMLDLGETEDSIAEKTGFSKTTVRHRLNIAKLNQKVLQEKEKDECFQLSLKDLYELEKIPDVKTRNKILKESTSSNNLAQKARSVADEIKRKEREKAYIKLCKAEGIKPAPEGAESEQYSGKWEKVKEFELDKDVKDKLGCKTQAAKEDLFYVVWWRTFTIIKKKGKEKKELSEYELQQKAKDKRKRQIKAMQKEMSAERADFVKLAIEKKFKPESEKPEAVMERLFGVMVQCGSWMSEQVMLKFITGETSLYNKTDEEKAAYEKQRDGIGLLYKMMIYASNGVADKDLAEWNATYRKSSGEVVMLLDEILALFGFSYSKEEFYKLAEGSHDLYKDGEADGK